jgi:hypothetical protein
MSRAQQKLQQFDVFSKAFKGEWKFSGSVTAQSSSDAKYRFMSDNNIINPNSVAVYQKR